ncbi:Uncharacterised protein [Streptococcus pneumoniae]|nr:Uncharacterised protein [Streptococcus pneumoniae]
MLNSFPKISKNSTRETPETKAVTKPAKTTVAIVSNFKIKPTTMIAIPINLIHSISNSFIFKMTVFLKFYQDQYHSLFNVFF